MPCEFPHQWTVKCGFECTNAVSLTCLSLELAMCMAVQWVCMACNSKGASMPSGLSLVWSGTACGKMKN
jgi:hypothetical protein